MTRLTEVEINCLNSACDDYENVNHINESVAEALGKRASEISLMNALRRLLQLGLMDGFLFDKNKQTYNKVDPIGAYEVCDLWFYTSVEGQKQLDLNWKENPIK